MGLNDLSKKEVENVFSYTLSKYDSLDEFLDKFKEVLSKLYEHKDYKGGWDDQKIDPLLNEYEKKTDAIKKDYRDKKIVKLTGSSVNIIGGILSFTPFAPIGWGLLGIGSGMTAITDVVDLADKSKQNAWAKAKNALCGYVENPFKDTAFQDIYESLIKTYKAVTDKISNDDYSVILQGMGWNYFLFRSNGKSHEEAIELLKDVLVLFKTKRYTISTELRLGDSNAIKDIQLQVTSSANSLYTQVGALGMIGIMAGIGATTTLAGIRVAGLAFSYAENIAHCLLVIGNGSMRFIAFMTKVSPAIAVVGGVTSIVVNSIALHNLEQTFKPYYDFKDECKKLYDSYKDEYKKTDAAITAMYQFMNEHASQKEQ